MYRKQRAVTLLELMLALAILSIIVLIAIPTWQATVAYGRRAQALNALRVSLALARSTAIAHGITVDLCTSHDHHHCDNGDWDEGWIVFVDQDADYKHEDGERILHVNAALAESSHLRGNRLIAHHVGFQRYGMMHGVHNGTITYTTTPSRPALLRCLIVSRTGRTRTADGKDCP